MQKTAAEADRPPSKSERPTPAPTALAFLWHFHQPHYGLPDEGPVLPWVRLHATRGYFDLAWLHDRHPQLQGTVNFVPVLVEQLEAFIAGERDRYWRVAQKPARDLTGPERAFLVERFFAVHFDHGIRPRPRYHALHHLRERGPDAFSLADLRDLQVLFNLAWFGFAARIEYPFLAEMEAKGRDFREDEKRKVLDLQLACARRILPLWRALAARGQIELTTTPYAHPILPLIIDTEVMKGCQPRATRPPRFAHPSDAALHIDRALAHHQAWVGEAPVGCWPAEGAVSREAAVMLAERGIRWLATDEAQLFRVLPRGTPRTALYQPWRFETGEGRPLDVVFRDRTLSDLIGFTYARNPAPVAVADLLARVRATPTPPGRPGLVVIALDGENPWESFPESGRLFLETLAESMASATDLASVRLGPYLEAHPPTATLPELPPGSWINGDFGIWIGDPVDNTAWRLLGDTRRALERHASHPGALAAREHLLIAEGSDWFWWYGEPFHGDHKADFDHIFRARLRAAWHALDQNAPDELDTPLEPPPPATPAAMPDRFLSPRFAPGDSTWFEWAGAGSYLFDHTATAMHSNTRWYRRLLFGFDKQFAYFRFEPFDGIDFTHTHLTLRLNEHSLTADLCTDTEATLTGPGLDAPTPVRTKRRGGILELGVPFSALALTPGDSLRAAARLFQDHICLARYPASGEIRFTVPDADFELGRWTA